MRLRESDYLAPMLAAVKHSSRLRLTPAVTPDSVLALVRTSQQNTTRAVLDSCSSTANFRFVSILRLN